MAIQTVFRRYELKYLLTEAQKEQILQEMALHMKPDPYGETVIRNVYYDTEDYRLIRRSMEKPRYKEKIRLRSYRRVGKQSSVFVELKKKYHGVVYKRRASVPQEEAFRWLGGDRSCRPETQIGAEVDYFLSYYGPLRPALFLSYRREAYFSKEDPNFRVTFDDTILCRQRDISLDSEVYGTELLPEGKVLMEIKCAGGMPLWMTHLLSRQQVYKTSFSKYGTAYEKLIYPRLRTQTKNCNEEATDYVGSFVSRPV
ncbi:MAG: polyphosphate polymerase domain-containing protein [Ruminococcaceae bacterium]|nr:polyphosphate polymerase domain-containing protein [Oscillospiraceae bacterium]